MKNLFLITLIYLLVFTSCTSLREKKGKINDNNINTSVKKEYYKSGQLESKTIYFEDSLFVKERYNYYTRVRDVYDNGVKQPREVMWLSSLTRGYIKDSLELTTEGHTYYQNRRVASYSYLLRNRKTKIFGYDVKGNLRSIREFYNFQNDGKYISFYSNNQTKSEGIYKVGYKEGEWKYYYSNGNLKSRGKYVKGKDIVLWDLKTMQAYKINEQGDTLAPEPAYSNWNETEGFYGDIGFPIYLWFKDGKWEYWDEKGILIKEEFYEKGKLIDSSSN